METNFRSGLILIAGLVLLAASAMANSLSVNSSLIALLLFVAGALVTGWALYALRDDLKLMFSPGRRGLLSSTLSVLALLVALAWASALYPLRLDMTANKEYSL